MGPTLVLVILISLIGYNIVPVINLVLPWISEYTFLSDLFIINPSIAFISGLIFGLTNGLFFWVAIIIGALFIPTALFFMNSSALVYVIIYIVIAFVGLFVGSLIHNRKQQRSNIEQSIRRHGYYN
ncbi:MAG TPA: hypothetical protein GX703_05550 [Erysipelothrix sp.]|jgi:K+-sensing histidine kinase KdpD|nr:hypothetical protein [Erysipelothrix sp.]